MGKGSGNCSERPAMLASDSNSPTPARIEQASLSITRTAISWRTTDNRFVFSKDLKGQWRIQMTTENHREVDKYAMQHMDDRRYPSRAAGMKTLRAWMPAHEWPVTTFTLHNGSSFAVEPLPYIFIERIGEGQWCIDPHIPPSDIFSAPVVTSPYNTGDSVWKDIDDSFEEVEDLVFDTREQALEVLAQWMERFDLKLA